MRARYILIDEDGEATWTNDFDLAEILSNSDTHLVIDTETIKYLHDGSSVPQANYPPSDEDEDEEEAA